MHFRHHWALVRNTQAIGTRFEEVRFARFAEIDTRIIFDAGKEARFQKRERRQKPRRPRLRASTRSVQLRGSCCSWCTLTCGWSTTCAFFALLVLRHALPRPCTDRATRR